jgi:uncharacterized pyridoxal phosphate-containing UPF0001 family protein
MIEPVARLEPAVVAENLRRVRADIAATGRDPATVEILAAIKYVPAELLGALAAGGISTVGENRVQDLLAKQERTGITRFAHWDFIGALQSRKVAALLGRVRYIHSLASETALAQLGCHDPGDTRLLIEVNVAADPAKAGIEPAALESFLTRCPIPVVGLMTMPPQAATPEASRPAFRALAELARAHGLAELSMGTSQDYRVAVEEGATIIRLGRGLFIPS